VLSNANIDLDLDPEAKELLARLKVAKKAADEESLRNAMGNTTQDVAQKKLDEIRGEQLRRQAWTELKQNFGELSVMEEALVSRVSACISVLSLPNGAALSFEPWHECGHTLTSASDPHKIRTHIRSAYTLDPHPHEIRICIRSAPSSDPHPHEIRIPMRSASESDPHPHQIRIHMRCASKSDAHPHQIRIRIRSASTSDPHPHQILIRIRSAST
jgi:hypothetical protein